MNKKLSTFLFIIGGTILNLILMLTFIIGLLKLVVVILSSLGYQTTDNIFIPFAIAAIFGGLVLAFVVYSKITKYIQKKFDLEKHLEPIFGKKRK